MGRPFTVTGTLPAGADPVGVVVDPAGTRLYVTNDTGMTGSVSVLDTATGALVATVPVGWDPRRIAITPDGRQVAVANEGDGTPSLINTGTNVVTATVYVSRSPWAVAISPDGTIAYVTDIGAQGTYTVTATIPGFQLPVGVAAG